MNYDWLNAPENALIYIGDAMCSWCYGFADNLTKIVANHPELNLKLVMGGLRPFNTERAIDMADFLKGHWDEINARTGQPFGYDILSDPNFIYDTEPASRAVVVARIMAPNIEFDFFKAVQTAFYRDNQNTNAVATYLKLATQFGLDPIAFQNHFESDAVKVRTKADFDLSKQLGVRGFPSLIIKYDNRFVLLSNGYVEAEQVEENIKRVMG